MPDLTALVWLAPPTRIKPVAVAAPGRLGYHQGRIDRQRQGRKLPTGHVLKGNTMRIAATLVFAGALSLAATCSTWSQTTPPKAATAPQTQPTQTQATQPQA